MNNYYLRVIAGTSTIFDITVTANGFTWSESGVYEFWQVDENGKRFGVAYYPVDKTIIESIDYNLM